MHKNISLLAFCGLTAMAGFAQPPESSQDFLSIPPPAKYWMRMYPLREYNFFWHIDIEVADLAKAKDKVLKILKKHSGTLSHPLEGFPSSKRFGYQQFSYSIRRADAAKALAKLKDLGHVQSLSQKPGEATSLPEEVGQKLGKLKAERDAARDMLDKKPSISAAITEIIEHLERVEKTYRDSEDRVLFNIVLQTQKK